MGKILKNVLEVFAGLTDRGKLCTNKSYNLWVIKWLNKAELTSSLNCAGKASLNRQISSRNKHDLRMACRVLRLLLPCSAISMPQNNILA